MKSEQSITIRDLLQEAEDNHNGKRYRDAARTFRSVANMAIDEHYIEDAIYFMYRAIIDYDYSDDEFDKITNLIVLGQTTLKYASQLAVKRIETSQDKEEKIRAIQLAQQSLKLMGDEDNRVPLLKSLVRLHFDQAIESTGTARISMLEKAFSLSMEYDNKNSKEIGLKIVETYQQEAVTIVTNEGIDPYETAVFYQCKAILFAMKHKIPLSQELQEGLIMYTVNILDHIQEIKDPEELEKEKQRLLDTRDQSLETYDLKWLLDKASRKEKFSSIL